MAAPEATIPTTKPPVSKQVFDALIANPAYKEIIPNDYQKFSATMQKGDNANKLYAALVSNPAFKDKLPDEQTFVSKFVTAEKKRDAGSDDAQRLVGLPEKVSDVATPSTPALNAEDVPETPGKKKSNRWFPPLLLGKTKEPSGPVETFAKSALNVLSYQLPASTSAVSGVTVGSIADVGQQIRELGMGQNLSPEEKARVMNEGTKAEIEAMNTTERTEKGKQLKQTQQDLFAWAVERQAEGAEFTKDLINDRHKINGPMDAINWVAYAVGQAVGQIPLTMATGGASAAIQEVGEVYMSGVREIAAKQGITPEEVINRGMDDPATAAAYGLAAASLERLGAGSVVKNMTKGGLGKDLARRALMVLESGGTEAITEGAQTILEQAGAQVSSGKSVWDTDIDWDEVIEASAQGAVGGGGLVTPTAVGAPKLEKETKAEDVNGIPNEMRTKAKEGNKQIQKKVANDTKLPEVTIEAPVGDLGTMETKVPTEPAAPKPGPEKKTEQRAETPKTEAPAPAVKQEPKPEKPQEVKSKEPKPKENAIQKQSPAEVPVQPETKPSKKVEERVPEPELKKTPKQSKKEEVEGKPAEQQVEGKKAANDKKKPEVVYESKNKKGKITKAPDGTVTIANDKGKVPSLPTQRKYADEYIAKEGKKTPWLDTSKLEDQDQYIEEVAQSGTNPQELALAYEMTNETPDDISVKDQAIIDSGITIKREDYIHYGDEKRIGIGLAKSYFDPNSRPLDTQAQEISETLGIEVTPQDIIDHMDAFPGRSNYDPAKRERLSKLSDRLLTQWGRAMTPDVAARILAEDVGVSPNLNKSLEKMADKYDELTPITDKIVSEFDAIFANTKNTLEDYEANKEQLKAPEQRATEESTTKPKGKENVGPNNRGKGKKGRPKAKLKPKPEPTPKPTALDFGTAQPGSVAATGKDITKPKPPPKKLSQIPEKEFVKGLEPGQIVVDQDGDRFVINEKQKGNVITGTNIKTGTQREIANTHSGKLKEGITQKRFKKANGKQGTKLSKPGTKPGQKQPARDLQARQTTKTEKEGTTPSQQPQTEKHVTPKDSSGISRGAQFVFNISREDAGAVAQYVNRAAIRWGKKEGKKKSEFYKGMVMKPGDNLQDFLKGIEEKSGEIPLPSMKHIGPSKYRKGRTVTMDDGSTGLVVTPGGNLMVDTDSITRAAKNVFTNAKKWVKANLTTAGLLPKWVYNRSQQLNYRIDARTRQINFTIDDFRAAAKEDMKGIPSEQTMNEINDVLRGDLPMSAINDMPNVQAVVLTMRAEVDRLSQELLESGIVSENMEGTIQDNLGVYLNRSYRAHDLGKKWAKYLKDNPEGQQILNRAVAHLEQQYDSRRKNMIKQADNLENMSLPTAKKEHFIQVHNQVANDEPNLNPGAQMVKAEQIHEDTFNFKNIQKSNKRKAKKLREKAEELKQRDVTAQVESIIQEHINPQPFVKGGKLGSKDLGVLKKRLDIDAPIRELLGEYQDPRINYAKSVTKMSALIEKNQFLEDIKAQGIEEGWLSTKAEGKNTVKLAGDNTKTYAPLNGMYTTPEIAEAFDAQVDRMNSGYRAVLKWIALAKMAKTIGSISTHFRNIWGNAGFMAMGGYFLNTPMNTGAIKNIWGDLRGTKNKASREKIKEYYRLGILGEDIRGGELQALAKDFNENVQKSGSIEEAFDKSQMTSMTRKVGQAFTNVGTKAYKAEDGVWKMAAYEIELRRYTNALKNDPTYVNKDGTPTEALKQHTADIITNAFPTYSKVPRAIQAIRRIPFFGSFVSFPSEVIRTTKNTIAQAKKELNSPNKEIRKIGGKRAAGVVFWMGVTSVLGKTMQAMFGVTDEEDWELEKFVAPWAQAGRRLYYGKDGTGGFSYIDIAYTDPHDLIKRQFRTLFSPKMREEPIEAAKQIAYIAFSPFIGEDLAWQRLVDISRNKKKESGGKVYFESDPYWTKNKKVIKHLTEPLIPGTYLTAERIVDAIREGDEGVNEYGRKKRVSAEVAAAFGIRPEELETYQALFFKMKSFNNYLSDAKSKYNTEFYRKGGDQIESWNEYQDRFEETMFDMREHVNAAKTLGVPQKQIQKTLKDSGVAQKYHPYLLGRTGRIPAPKKNKKKR